MNKLNPSNLWSISEDIQQLGALLKSGDFLTTEKKLKNWLKKNSPKPFERIRISEYYTWMGLDAAAAKILGPPLGLSELRAVSAPELCIQLRLSYMLGMMGAKYVALNLMKNIQEIMGSEGEAIANHYPQYYQNFAYLNLTYYLCKNARWGFEKALDLYDSKSYQHFYISLGLSDCDAIEGDYDSATGRVEKLVGENHFQSDQLLLATAHQAWGEYLNYAQKFDNAREHFDQSFTLFGSTNKSKDYAYLLKHSGLNRIWSDTDRTLGIKELLAARDLLARPDQTPTSLVEVLFWINHYAPSELCQDERLTLLAYPNYSVYSLSAGRARALSDETRVPNWIPKDSETTHDIWVTHNDEIISLSYQQFSHQDYPGDVIDLKASLVFKTSGEVSGLSELQAKILLALAGGGARGVHQYLLTDSIYRQEFVNWESGLDRIKKAVKSLSKFGVKIAMKNLNYVWDREKETLILPTDLTPRAWHPYARKVLTTHFTSDCLAKVLAMSTRNAQRLIKEWRQEGLIELHAPHSYVWRGVGH